MMARCRYQEHDPRHQMACLAIVLIVFGAIAFAVALFTRPARGEEPHRKSVVLCFTQPNCPQCVVQKPNWDAFKRANPGVSLIPADTTKFPAATRKWKVTTTPTTIIVKADDNGESIEHRRFVGVVSPQAIRGALP